MPGLAGRQPTRRLIGLAVLLLAALASLLALPAQAQTFPKLTGRVVDGANIIPDDVEARLVQKLDGLEKQSQRQVVVVTLPDLQGYDIADYGYQLGRNWGIGDKERNDGALLIVAPTERKVRIEVGYGLEPILTDGLTSLIVQQQIVPAFKAGDMPAGIEAGTDAIIKQLTLPAEEAAKVAQQAQSRPKNNDASPGSVIFFIFLFFLIFILPAMIRSRRGGRRYRDDSGLGTVIMWSVLEGLASGRSHGGGGGFSGGGGFGGGGGFSGGGGSFGGGGSSGSW
ncbi:TPM domain-containing protein [Novosphingobium sp. MW5]|nr:TPM domain-containing protein [Novosphingobium sp. MW5]